VENFSRPASLDVLAAATGQIEDVRSPRGSDVFPAVSSDGPAIEGLLKSITGREAEVLRLRYGLYSGHAMTLDEIGKKLNLTRERIRQIQKRALHKLQGKLTDARAN
jgi:RNA polymerase primary sigma factor